MLSKLFFLAAMAAALGAQTSLNWSAPTVLGRPGQTVTASLTLSGSVAPVALQWTAPTPSGWTATWTRGMAAATANKQVASGPSATILYASSAPANTTIGAGVVANLALTIPATATGPQTITLSGLQGVVINSGGAAVSAPVTSTAGALTINVLAREDLNGDGKIDAADIQIALDGATGTAACPLADANGDGVCNVLDVMVVVLRMLGI